MVSSAKIDFGAMRTGAGAVTTPCVTQAAQARFSRLMTRTKYSAGFMPSTSVVSYPMIRVSVPHLPHRHCSAAQAMISSMRSRCAGSSFRPGCCLFLRLGVSPVFSCAAAGSGPLATSVSISSLDTAGSQSRSSNWRSLSFSLCLPYLRMRSRRSSSFELLDMHLVARNRLLVACDLPILFRNRLLQLRNDRGRNRIERCRQR